MSPAAADDEVLGRVYDARLVRRLLEYVRPQTRLIAASLALMFAVTAAGLVQPWLIKRLIDEHIVTRRLAGAGSIALLYLAVFLVEQVTRYLQLYTMERTGQNIIRTLRDRVFAHLQRCDLAFFDRYPVGRLMTRVTTDVESLADLFSSGVVSLLGDSLKLAAIVVILLWLDARLALVTFTIVPALFLLSVFFRGRIRQAYRDVRRRIARINAYLQEAISGMLLIQLFRREAEDRRLFDSINREHRDAELRSVVFESSFSAIIELIGALATAAILWYGGGRFLRGALTLGTLVAFLEYTGRFFAPIRDLSGFYAVLQAAMASLERIFALLDDRPAIVSPAVAQPAAAASGRVEFDAVRFAYAPGREVLRDISLTIEPGEKIALVGATGSGKTTLVKLLIRLYDPTSGTIRLDGRELRDLPLPWLRRQIGIVLQDHFLFTGTVADNIAFGCGPLASERIEAAARLVHADEFIRRLPGGYGEPLLEQDALRALLRGRTAILIAHRLSTIAGADRILVMHHGRLAEQGTHRALLARGGIYARLCALQFGWEEELNARGARAAAAGAADAGAGPEEPLFAEPRVATDGEPA